MFDFNSAERVQKYRAKKAAAGEKLAQFYLPADALEGIDLAAKKEGLSRAEVVAKWGKTYLARHR
jgi:hypothetical protein